MVLNDIPGLILSALSFIVAVVAVGISFRSRQTASAALLVQHAVLENQIADSLSSAANNMQMAIIHLAKTTQNVPEYNFVKKNADASIQNWINAYDLACQKYREGKVDKDSFRRSYQTSIRQMVERPDLKDNFDPLTSNFVSVVTVYREWVIAQK